MTEFKVSKEYRGWRLDKFLQARFPDFSRAWIKKLIKKRPALVNNREAAPAKKLRPADTVAFEFEPPPEISLEPDASLAGKIKIIFENKDFIVVAKPAGLSAHPSSTEPRGTLANWLIFHHPPILSVGDSMAKTNLRPGLVHRLDKDTSGVMVAAKNQQTFLWLKRQFQSRSVTKKYIALVNGSPKQASGRIDSNIVRSQSDPTKNAAARSKEIGRPSLTYWKVLKRYADHTLLEVMPKTGRMHQIRVHLKAAGLPIAGDKKYGSPKKDPKHLGRMFLHAEYLGFTGPSSEKFSFGAPLPAELRSVLRNLPFVVR